MKSLVLALLLAALQPVSARADAPCATPPAVADGAVVPNGQVTQAMATCLDPTTVEKTAQELDIEEALVVTGNQLLTRVTGVPVLRDFNLKLKAFHVFDKETNAAFSYDFAKVLRKAPLGNDANSPPSTNYQDLQFSIVANGNIALNAHDNEENLLDTHASLSFFRSDGGVSVPQPGDAERYRAIGRSLIPITDPAELAIKRRELVDLLTRNMSNQTVFTVNADLGFETDQQFEATQLVYGASAGFALNGWEKRDAKTWSETSSLAKWNVFDYPFAGIRWLTAMDDSFVPRGMSFPALLVQLAEVSPQGDDPRKAVGDDSSFPRVRAEVAFKTPLMELSPYTATKIFGTVYFSTDFRYYQEISASRAVRSANLDNYHYLVTALSSSSGVFLSYTAGRLPFDATNDQIFQAGYQFHF